MRMLSLVFSFLITVSLAIVALVYLEDRIGQHRIYVQDEWLSATDQQAYHGYGQLANTDQDTTWVATGDSTHHPR
jgi:hypothetical protein